MKSTRSLFSKARRSITKAFRRSETFPVKINVDITLPGARHFGNRLTLSSEHKTVKLYFDGREHVWRLWQPTQLISTVKPFPEGGSRKVLEVTRFRHKDIDRSFVPLIEEQVRRKVKTVVLTMDLRQLIEHVSLT